MSDRFGRAVRLLDESAGTVFTAAAAQIRHRGRVVFDAAAGTLASPAGSEADSPSPRRSFRAVRCANRPKRERIFGGTRNAGFGVTHTSGPPARPRSPAGESVARLAGPDTLFDLASLTKLFTTTAFLSLVGDGLVALDMPVSALLPEFTGTRPVQPYENPLVPGAYITVAPGGSVDAGRVTFRHLLAHTSGLPAWRPLYRLPPAAIRETVLKSFFSYPTGTRVVYSDLGLMLLGWAMEAATGRDLAALLTERVVEPLGLTAIGFGPVPPEQSAATEWCAWRGRRVHGEVHDENAAAQGGVAPHAGLFGTAAAVAAFGAAWLEFLSLEPCPPELTGGTVPLPRPLAVEAVSAQTPGGDSPRGLGWVLWSPDPAAPINALGVRAFGHTGFTGTSLYVDPDLDLVVALLTNHVYYGRGAMGAIQPLRRAFNEAAVEAVR